MLHPDRCASELCTPHLPSSDQIDKRKTSLRVRFSPFRETRNKYPCRWRLALLPTEQRDSGSEDLGANKRILRVKRLLAEKPANRPPRVSEWQKLARSVFPASLVSSFAVSTQFAAQEFEQLWGNDGVRPRQSCTAMKCYGRTGVCGRRAHHAARKPLTRVLQSQNGGSLCAADALSRRLALLFFP